MSQEVLVHKFTLSSQKTVMLREFKLKHQELAIRAVGNRAGGNQALHNHLIALEMVKILLIQVDGKEVSKSAVEDLDSLFTPREFAQVQKAIMMVSGMGEDDEDPKCEIVTSGSR